MATRPSISPGAGPSSRRGGARRRTHLIWQDVTREGYPNRVQSWDHKTAEWSEPTTLDLGIDNHARGFHQATCYARSPDCGNRWEKSDGTPVSLPARPEDLEQHVVVRKPRLEQAGLVWLLRIAVFHDFPRWISRMAAAMRARFSSG